MYCILHGEGSSTFKANGIKGGPVYTVDYRDISAVVSDVAFKEISPSMDDVVAHNKVVEAARGSGVVLPVRFGVIFRNKDGTRKLLRTSYKGYKSKLAKLRGKDELGLKVVLEKEAMGKIESLAREESEEAKKIRLESASSGEGTSYFLKLKLDDIVRNEALNKISMISEQVHDELTETAEESRLLKTELDQVVLNSVYLVETEKVKEFNKRLAALERKYEPMGFSFHVSGPWAPYSFC